MIEKNVIGLYKGMVSVGLSERPEDSNIKFVHSKENHTLKFSAKNDRDWNNLNRK
jgi:hypothetical protein